VVTTQWSQRHLSKSRVRHSALHAHRLSRPKLRGRDRKRGRICHVNAHEGRVVRHVRVRFAAEFAFLRQRVETGTVKSSMRAIAVRLYQTATDPQISAFLTNGAAIVQLTGLIK
jgi:hypothetical protein